MELGDPGVPLLRRPRRRNDDPRRDGDAADRARRGRTEHVLAAHAAARLRADQSRDGGAVPRPHAQAVRVARVPDARASLADVVGLVGADRRLRRAARVGADPAARRMAVARPAGAGAANGVGRTARAAGAGQGARVGEHRARRRTRHLHRDPAQHHGRPAAVEQRDPRAALPRSPGCRRGPRWCTSPASRAANARRRRE